MRFAHFFIERPRFASVLSILFVVVGLLAYLSLPVAQYPQIAPPTVRVRANYPGATPQAIAQTVATPIEEQINGVENMLYMSSQATNDGAMQITVTFAPGTDLDIAQVQVQNRVAVAEPRLPEEVRRTGVLVEKSSPDLMMVIHLQSPNAEYDDLYVSNYAVLHVRDVLTRIDGVGSLTIFGAREYSMRIWLNPDRMAAHDLSAEDVVHTLRAQNVQIIGGALNQPPMPNQDAFQLVVSAQGRFVDAEEFGNAIVKTDAVGRVTRVEDVARIEMGALSYSTNSHLDGKPAVGIGIFQLPGSNLLETATELRATMAELATHFPEGLEYQIAYDPTVFVEESVSAVYETIFEAVLLVILVIVAFLQSWRAAIVPIVAIPVSLIGTFAAMAALGFSLNNLSLFGLVLAIGVVVDDAIVVVENIERNLAKGMSARESAHVTMDEVGSALVAMALVLAAVFVPTAFLGGIPGQFFLQFAVTISTAVVISGFNSLTLSPALGALVMKPKDAPKSKLGQAVARVVEPFYRTFNRGLEAGTERYIRSLGPVVAHPKMAAAVFIALLGLTGLVLWRVPTGFIPEQDQGYLIVAGQLPQGAALSRTDAVVTEAAERIRAVPGVNHTVEIVGFSGATFSAASNAAAIFVTLKPFSERGPSQSAPAIAQQLWGLVSGIREAQFFVIEPPAVRGLGRGGGFKLMVEDRSGLGLQTLEQKTWELIGAANETAGLQRVFSTFSVTTPQYDLDIDRTRAEMLGVPLENVFST
ncbi:MAG: efflux RND transporter permease subunit, partial [Polyangiales bacterium]